MGRRLFFAALIFVLIEPHFAAADEYRVYRSQLECVRDNAEKYLNQPGDVITIILPACPIVDPLEAFRSLAKNNAFKRNDNDQSKTDAILRIMRNKLPCILKEMDSTAGDPINISTDGACER
ncbi:hypothetical protein [Aminobacter sp. HY435]|uniref:hypothetical protein n=1 Tax=Aminobacter sp. HY435 TaxID=2970917 RepID=UPI0022B98D23|nr:hypothetical protein [Aminobacter sp. HY435]